MRVIRASHRISRATVLTGFAGLAVVAGGAGIAAATTDDASTTGTDAGYGVVVDAPDDAPDTATATDTDCPWSNSPTGADGATDTTLAGAR